MIAAASIELILNPLDREGIAGTGFNRFYDSAASARARCMGLNERCYPS
jgi:hypothetical protein